MVPWTNLITGVVGVVGIGGTILAALIASNAQTANLKLSISAENERVRLNEKRNAYVRHLAALADLLKTSIDLNAYVQTGEIALKDAATDAFSMAMATAIATVSEVRLIAPDDVADCAVRVIDALRHEGPREQMLRNYRHAHGRLIAAMRADLGETQPETP